MVHLLRWATDEEETNVRHQEMKSVYGISQTVSITMCTSVFEMLTVFCADTATSTGC